MLPKQQRLKNDKDFKKVFKHSKKFESEHFSLFLHHNNDRTNLPARIGVVISAKVAKNATDRNKAKRVGREIIRLEMGLEDMLGKDFVLLYKKLPEDWQKAAKELKRLLLEVK